MIIIERPLTAEEKIQMEVEICKPSNEQIRELRQQAYKDRSDSLYLAWQKYLALEDDRAEQAKQMWLAEVAKIDKEFPYNE
jgi:rRNA maturation endonuclease Nob1